MYKTQTERQTVKLLWIILLKRIWVNHQNGPRWSSPILLAVIWCLAYKRWLTGPRKTKGRLLLPWSKIILRFPMSGYGSWLSKDVVVLSSFCHQFRPCRWSVRSVGSKSKKMTRKTIFQNKLFFHYYIGLLATNIKCFNLTGLTVHMVTFIKYAELCLWQVENLVQFFSSSLLVKQKSYSWLASSIW